MTLTTQYFESLMGLPPMMPVSLDDIIFGLIVLSFREDNLGGPYNNPPVAVFGGEN